VGVEPEGAAKMTQSLAAGRPVTLDKTGSIADGLMAVRPGDLNFAHVREYVDEVVTVGDGAIECMVPWLFRHSRLVVEPSGAVAAPRWRSDWVTLSARSSPSSAAATSSRRSSRSSSPRRQSFHDQRVAPRY
jgi:threonine dehydratase